MTPHNATAEQPEARGLSESARGMMDFLRQRGASFFTEIVRGTGKLKAEVETATMGTGGCRRGHRRRL